MSAIARRPTGQKKGREAPEQRAEVPIIDMDKQKWALLNEKLDYFPLDTIKPNPWQVERHEDAHSLQDLATSILQHGLVETPVGRVREDLVELACGHRRLAAHRLLVERGHPEYGQMRVRITALSNSQMADIVIQENKKRQDMDPIAEARFYRRYRAEFKVSQRELARRVGCSQGEIGNTLRLLDLPDQAQAMVISREITPRHGRELLRVDRWPEVQKAAMEALAREYTPVAEFSDSIDLKLTRNAKPLGNHAAWNGVPQFNLAGCNKCPDRVMAARGGAEKKPWCMNPTCWEKKQEEAVAAEEAKLQAKIEKVGAGALHSKLPYGTYETLASYNLHRVDSPEECQSCERRHFLKGHGVNPEPICVDLKCFKAKMVKKTRAENERLRREKQHLSDRIDAALSPADTGGRICHLLVMEVLLRLGWSDVSRWFHKEYSLAEKEKASSLDRLPTLLKGKSDEEIAAMVPRVAVEVLRNNYGARGDRLNHYLRELEGGPSEVELKLTNGETQKVALDEILLVKEYRAHDGKPSQYCANYGRAGNVSSVPITEETAQELLALGVKQVWDYASEG